MTYFLSSEKINGSALLDVQLTSFMQYIQIKVFFLFFFLNTRMYHMLVICFILKTKSFQLLENL